MLITLRRTLLLWAFLFWQGGFFFYASVVVKVGTDLTSQFDQGLITQQVTIWLNVAALGALLLWLWDLFAERAALTKTRWLLWIFMFAMLVWLAWMHPQLGDMINTERGRVEPRQAFRSLHAVYLWVSTAQWAASIAFSFCTLLNWRAADRAAALKG
jgi:hypothetical protein